MKRRVTYRPSKAQGAFGVIAGSIFVLIGLFIVIPMGGLFGVLWTLFAAVGTGMNAYQAFGKSYAGPEIRIEDEEGQIAPNHPSPPPSEPHDHIPSMALDPKRRLEQLESLKDAGLINDQEYHQKRSEILQEL